MLSRGLCSTSMGNMVRGASRSCGRHTQCLFRPDSTPSLPPKAIPGRQGAPVRKGIRKGLCGRPRGSRVRREGCAKQTPGCARLAGGWGWDGGQPTLAGSQTGGWGWGGCGCGNGAHAACKGAPSVLFYLGVCQVDSSTCEEGL